MNLTLKIKDKIVHTVMASAGASIIIGCLVAAVFAVYSSARVRPTVSKQAVQPRPVIQLKPIEQTPTIEPAQAPVERFENVEAYFKDAYPNPLTHRFNQRRFARDVSSSQRRRIIERDGGCCLVCGSTIKLEVDHRVALMNNGGNEDAKVGTLCDDCHKLKTRLDWKVQKQRRKRGEHH